jgi:hypothetical protein
MAPALVWVGPEGIDRQVIDQEMAVSTTLDNGASVLVPQWGLIHPLVDRMFRR